MARLQKVQIELHVPPEAIEDPSPEHQATLEGWVSLLEDEMYEVVKHLEEVLPTETVGYRVIYHPY